MTRRKHTSGIIAGLVLIMLILGMVVVSAIPFEHARATGGMIDLYTQNERQYPEGTWTPYNGMGSFINCDSFAPGENISLLALVTYDSNPLQHILVGFEVKNPNGATITYRVAETNLSGTAAVWFRVPIPCDPEEEELLFGHWEATAKCKIRNEVINDTMHFKVGWIVEIIELETVPYDEWYKEETIGIDVTLENIGWVPRNVTLCITVYDECDVPLGQVLSKFEIKAAPAVLCSNSITFIFVEIHVPKWAYVGVGTVYANAFTELPQETGILYCPKVAFSILIEMGMRS